ncbi:MAG: hypothetical protein A2W33_01720 [Chloroflexi bacterium RBG_16_52_11]|nr:MAG: hypothetical protein A2W33_01720 [Chloroflexi bacterium RBG_16_52_11]
MKHPLDFLPLTSRKPIFLALLALTLGLFAIFRVLNAPLVTSVAPGGIVTFELAGSPEKAFQVMASWEPVSGTPLLGIEGIKPYLFAAFGLGLDYLFMPAYTLALAVGALLAAGRHKGWFHSLGAVAAYGAFAAALLDGVENYALWHVLLGEYSSPYPALAAVCAYLKFTLIFVGIAYALIGWVLPKRS